MRSISSRAHATVVFLGEIGEEVKLAIEPGEKILKLACIFTQRSSSDYLDWLVAHWGSEQCWHKYRYSNTIYEYYSRIF